MRGIEASLSAEIVVRDGDEERTTTLRERDEDHEKREEGE